MINRFKNEFRENIAILHSKLTNKERADEWYNIYSGNKKIVLGVRSAIFAPVENLEYIILDEEHENTYKQDSNPRYNAKYVAIKKAELEGAKLILGSATPSIESSYYAEKGIYTLVTMDSRYNNSVLPEIEIIDMKKEEDLYFSKKLLEEMKTNSFKRRADNIASQIEKDILLTFNVRLRACRGMFPLFYKKQLLCKSGNTEMQLLWSDKKIYRSLQQMWKH